MNKVTHDLFDIVNRIRKINPAYEIFYNDRKQRLEIHANGHYELVVPNNTLDERVLDYARQTLVQNSHIMERDVDLHNERLKTSQKEYMDKAAVQLQDRLAFANRTGRTVTFTKNHLKEF